ncbi:MAG: hypothetical protein KBB39_01260 [Phycicoccus sp.]|nr:hypothetical protein [Phycicoccus sp.]
MVTASSRGAELFGTACTLERDDPDLMMWPSDATWNVTTLPSDTTPW